MGTTADLLLSLGVLVLDRAGCEALADSLDAGEFTHGEIRSLSEYMLEESANAGDARRRLVGMLRKDAKALREALDRLARFKQVQVSDDGRTKVHPYNMPVPLGSCACDACEKARRR